MYRTQHKIPVDDYRSWAESLGIETEALLDAVRSVGREKVILFMGPPPGGDASAAA
ncbi:MAG: hypothetical protein V4864_03840 [Pseudomonadota bacterium]